MINCWYKFDMDEVEWGLITGVESPPVGRCAGRRTRIQAPKVEAFIFLSVLCAGRVE